MTNDTKTTYLGIIMAAGTALADYLAHLGPNGLDLKSPTFWIGIVIAACMGLKGWFTNKANTTVVENTQTTKTEVTTPIP
jgi:hypothetical protein